MNRILLSISALLVSIFSFAQYQTLENQIRSIIHGKDATIGVAVLFDGKDLISVNDDSQYPMQSVFKFHTALATLDHLERNKLPLDTEITISKDDLIPGTHSPLRDKYPNGNVKLSIANLITYSTAESDNNACDILINYVGGPQAVDGYIKKLGIKDVSIKAKERDILQNQAAQNTNWTTPSSAVKLIEIFREKEIFCPEYKQFLTKTLIESDKNNNKIKGMLPEDVIVGHKTGSSSRNSSGIKGADNEIGFVQLPDGSGYSIAIFIKDSKETDQKNAEIMSRISRIVFENYILKNLN